MQLFKKIVFPLFSIFLIYRSIDLLRQLYYSAPIDFSFGELILIALLITLFVTGIFAFPGFAFPTSRVMPNRYWIPKNTARLNKIFNLLGVNIFKSILVLLFWGRKGNRKKYYNGTRTGLANFNLQSKQSEFGHLGAFLVILIISIILLLKGYFILVFLITILNVLFNFYPIILQRHHRIRILRLENQLIN